MGLAVTTVETIVEMIEEITMAAVVAMIMEVVRVEGLVAMEVAVTRATVVGKEVAPVAMAVVVARKAMVVGAIDRVGNPVAMVAMMIRADNLEDKEDMEVVATIDSMIAHNAMRTTTAVSIKEAVVAVMMIAMVAVPNL